MPLMPKRTKYRKLQRGSRKGLATSGNELSFGSYGLQCLDRAWITNVQIESCRVAINRSLKRKGKVWIRIFPHKSISKKPAETRQGTGKGDVEYWAAVVKPGTILYELDGVTEDVAKKAFNRVAHKLPIKVRMVRRRHV